jgi:ABC-type phosphate/phosphonate transport system substrate-binding protein
MKMRNKNIETRKTAKSRCPKEGFAVRCLFGFRMAAWLVLFLAGVATYGPAQEAEPDHPFRFAFSTELMFNVKEDDARAAMKVWADTLIKEGAVSGDPNILFCRDVATMISALQNRTADGMSTSLNDFFVIRDKVKFSHYVFGVTNGSIFEEYVILVHVDSGINQIEELRGRSLNALRHPRTCLALPWLDTLLLEKGLKPAQGFCGRITEEDKLTKAVLPVFFRQVDACLVTRKGFKTMGELNPQVSRQLRVLVTSPEIVPGAFFFRAGFPQPQLGQFLAELTKVHTRPAGQQVLTVFQTERLEEHPASVMDSAISLLENHRRLSGGAISPKTTSIDPATLNSKAKGSGK